MTEQQAKALKGHFISSYDLHITDLDVKIIKNILAHGVTDESKPLQAEEVGGKSVEEIIDGILEKHNLLEITEPLGIDIRDSMHDFAAQQVSIQTEAKDKEIAELEAKLGEITYLVERYRPLKQ